MIVSNQMKTNNGSFEVETEIKVNESKFTDVKIVNHTIILHQKGGALAPGTSLLQCTREELVQVRKAIELALGVER